MRLVIASSNTGKLRELAQLLRGLPFELATQDELGVEPIEETGTSFEENALLKVRHAATCTGAAAVADDSGLEVDALGGAPGIFFGTLRGARGGAETLGADADADAANNALLIANLQGISPSRRQASYRCVLAFMRGPDDDAPIITRGRWSGLIIDTPRGGLGFGYDPYFFLPKIGLTAAQLEPETKNRSSHRAQAMRALRRELARRR